MYTYYFKHHLLNTVRYRESRCHKNFAKLQFAHWCLIELAWYCITWCLGYCSQSCLESYTTYFLNHELNASSEHGSCHRNFAQVWSNWRPSKVLALWSVTSSWPYLCKLPLVVPVNLLLLMHKHAWDISYLKFSIKCTVLTSITAAHCLNDWWHLIELAL